jgi:hypothetical protein
MVVVIAGMAFDRSRILRVVANPANTRCTVFLDTGGVPPAVSFTLDGTLVKVLEQLENATAFVR